MEQTKTKQDKLNELFSALKREWDIKLNSSGLPEPIFIATDNTGFTGRILFVYQMAKEHAESEGLIMPVLIHGLSIKIEDQLLH